MKVGECLSNGIFTEGVDACVDLTAYRGKWLILYFYPKDATPVCTVQAREFRDRFSEITAMNAVVLGISRDGVKSHKKFKTNEALPFELISDPEERLCQQFDTIKMKSTYGKQVRGIERSTFILDPQGRPHLLSKTHPRVVRY